MPDSGGAPEYLLPMAMVPEHILEEWREGAEDNEPRRRHHHASQQWGRKHGEPHEECWDCQRAVAKCKAKIRHETIDTAWEQCLEMWPGKKLVPYRCFWTNGLHWHAKTLRGSADNRKLRRRIVRRLAKPNIDQ